MQDSFTAEVYRYAAIGTAVLRVLATDQDALQYEEEDSEVRYIIYTQKDKIR